MRSTMATDMFLCQSMSDNILEIQTTDDTKLYVSKIWLMNLSPYFEALLSNGFKESSTTSIKLNYKSKIISILFQCIYKSYLGKDVQMNIIKNLNELEDIYSFWSAVTEYQLDTIKNIADEYFSSQIELIKENFLNAESMSLIRMYKMESIRKAINHYFEEKDHVDSLNLETFPRELLDFFITTPVAFCRIFYKWANIHNPTDDELLMANIDIDKFKLFPERMTIELIQTIRGLTKAPKFLALVCEKISYVFIPLSTRWSGKPMSAYQEYITNKLKELRTERPGLTNTEYMQLAAKAWRREHGKGGEKNEKAEVSEEVSEEEDDDLEWMKKK